MTTAPALAGTTVLELTSGLPGSYCGRLLAMIGADVIKIESAARPDEARAAGTGLDRFLHAQKRSVELDVTTPDGATVLDRLAAGADVLLDDGALGRPPGVRERYEELLAAHPQLVVVALSPYGLDGSVTSTRYSPGSPPVAWLHAFARLSWTGAPSFSSTDFASG